MIYKDFGNTGIKTSLIGFGGMRFADAANIEKSAEMLVYAFDKGINYFDTAPTYCDDHSEDIFGLAALEIKKRGKPFYFSSKSQKKTGDELRAQLEKSLRRLNVDAIDFFNCWYVLTLADWKTRKSQGVVEAILKAKEEGLIKHAAFSTHLPGEEIRRVIEEGYFEAVTLGYSVLNFPYREDGVAAAWENNLGVVVMNPLGGGLLTGAEKEFEFIRVRKEQSNLEAALHFLFSDERIGVSLVGFRDLNDIDTAVAAVDTFAPYTPADREKIQKSLSSGMNSFCTSCRYCKGCPEDIKVWAFAETANHIMMGMSPAAVAFRLKSHWGVTKEDMDRCIQCGQCESACTQHIPIMERFELVKNRLAELA